MSATNRRRLWQTPTAPIALLLGAALLVLGGCGRSASTPESDEPPFEVSRLQTLPNDLGLLHQQAKPGHWTAATLDIKANRDDFRGQLASEVHAGKHIGYRLEVRRPATLPKQSLKPAELLFYVPSGHFDNHSPPIDIRLFESPQSRRPVMTDKNRLQRLMPAYQFYFLVLADEPDRYSFLMPGEAGVPAQNHARWLRVADYANYEVLVPLVKQRPPLPSHPLAWTMLAYILWDGFDPQQFTEPQQQAMLDWLHWGGQLIVSGPGSLELLQQSFLAPHLPATSQATLELAPSAIETFTRRLVPAHPPLRPHAAWLIESLRPSPQSETLATVANHPIVVDRRVGRGRIAVTAFPISRHELIGWAGAGELFDRVLLRRPRGPMASPRDRRSLRVFDPRRNSRFRILSRDGGGQRDVSQALLGGPSDIWDVAMTFDGHFRGGESVGGGVGAWNDHSPLSRATRQVLRSASEITVPSASRVAGLLGIYLLVLVPVNWTVFRLLGRPHWAWFAVPVISLAFTVIVAWVTQLDIGFVRARNEVRIVELHGGYARAHVTHYTALYASLSTTYRVRYDSPTALAVPFMSGARTIFRQRRPLIVLDQGPPVELRNLQIASNATGILHGEYFTDLPGAIELKPAAGGGWLVRNETGLNLHHAVLLAGNRVATLGRLPSGTTANVEFEPRDAGRAPPTNARRPVPGNTGRQSGSRPQRHRFASATATTRAGEIDLQPLLEVIEQFDLEDRGQWRLVARCDTAPGRVEIQPQANQSRRATVVVAYLKHAPLPAVVASAPPETPETGAPGGSSPAPSKQERSAP